MAGMPIAAANKTTVMAFFIIFLRQFALTIPNFIISPCLQGCTRATQTGAIAGWLTGSTLLRVTLAMEPLIVNRARAAEPRTPGQAAAESTRRSPALPVAAIVDRWL
jgi:hypothetical protein